MRRIYLTRPLMPIAREILTPYFYLEENREDSPISREKLLQVVKSFDGILSTIPDCLDQEVLVESQTSGKGLKVISNCAAGLDNVDVGVARRLGIAVFNVPGVTTHSTADL